MGGLLRDSTLCRLCSGDSGGGQVHGEGGVQERGCDAFAELLVLAWREVIKEFLGIRIVCYDSLPDVK